MSLSEIWKSPPDWQELEGGPMKAPPRSPALLWSFALLVASLVPTLIIRL